MVNTRNFEYGYREDVYKYILYDRKYSFLYITTSLIRNSYFLWANQKHEKVTKKDLGYSITGDCDLKSLKLRNLVQFPYANKHNLI